MQSISSYFQKSSKNDKLIFMRIPDRYLKGAVLGASDGIVTTFAVVAGVVGAGFATEIIIVLGIANMVADGISMAIGDFLGERSITRMHENNGGKKTRKASYNEGVTSIITFISFIVAGTLPLLPYLAILFGVNILQESQFLLSVVATLTAMFFVGSLRTYIIKGNWLRNGLEMLFVGSIAAIAAYTLGAYIENFIH
jgi:vacuolar iron transporter family protein